MRHYVLRKFLQQLSPNETQIKSSVSYKSLGDGLHAGLRKSFNYIYQSVSAAKPLFRNRCLPVHNQGNFGWNQLPVFCCIRRHIKHRCYLCNFGSILPDPWSDYTLGVYILASKTMEQTSVGDYCHSISYLFIIVYLLNHY